MVCRYKSLAWKGVTSGLGREDLMVCDERGDPSRMDASEESQSLVRNMKLN